jgi:NADH-quinone oxidoreductase subunit F/NADP-reducing hydrogenase subunit HndC
VCVNVSCEAYGSRGILAALTDALEGSDVEIRPIVCFGACEHAVNVLLYPNGTWYSHVQSGDVAEILAHIRGGELVPRLIGSIDPQLRELIMGLIDSGVE